MKIEWFLLFLVIEGVMYLNIREQAEEREFQYLSRYASHSRESKGRARVEEECDIRTVYQRDRDRIIHSKAFRRLKDKTQVFLAAQGDHYRTRLTHTLEVSQTARTIAKALELNEDLVEAIALGHDLGHTPFGHAGEAALNEICPEGFAHFKQSVRVVERLEKNGEGLNLTWEVRDGMLNHRTSGTPHTLEGQVVRLCDKISYIHHDMDDAQRAGIFQEDDIPITIRVTLGDSCKERLNTLIHDTIRNSYGKDKVEMTPEIAEGLMDGKYDIGFCSDLLKSEELEYYPIRESYIAVVVPKGHPLEKRESISLKEVALYPQIMFSKTSGFRNLQEQIFDKEGIKVRPVCTAEEIEVITGLVENGFGISVLPYMDIIRHHNIVAIPVQTSIWKSKFYIARRKYGIRSDQEEAFFQYWRKNRL